jgi:aspartate racemase
MNSLGIIGGLGPKATTMFYLSIIDKIKNQTNGRLPNIIIYSVPMHPEIENAFIQGLDFNEHPQFLLEVKTILQSAAEFFLYNRISTVVIACNTLQDIFDEICQQRNLRHLHMIDSTVQKCIDAGHKRSLIVGTTTTYKSEIYGSRLKNANIEYKYPNKKQQKVIEEFLRGILHFDFSKNLDIEFKKAVTEASFDCDSIIIACTDLTGFITNDWVTIDIEDSINELSKLSADYILGKLDSGTN